MIEQLNRRAAMKDKKNASLEQELPNLQATVAEREHIHEGIGNKTFQLLWNTLQNEILESLLIDCWLIDVPCFGV